MPVYRWEVEPPINAKEEQSGSALAVNRILKPGTHACFPARWHALHWSMSPEQSEEDGVPLSSL